MYVYCSPTSPSITSSVSSDLGTYILFMCIPFLYYSMYPLLCIVKVTHCFSHMHLLDRSRDTPCRWLFCLRIPLLRPDSTSLFHTLPRLYLTLPHSTLARPDSTSLYHTLPWLEPTLPQSTTLYPGSTLLYLTLPFL